MATKTKKPARKAAPKKAAAKKAPASAAPAPVSKLKPAEELFCQLFAGSTQYFNNATQAYIVAYDMPEIEVPEVTYPAPEKIRVTDEHVSDAETLRTYLVYPDWYLAELRARDDAEEAIRRQERTAAACASRLLRKANIRARCAEVLEARLTDADVDRELSRIIHQQADLNVKIRGIAEYNKLKGRIIERRHHTGTVVVDTMSDKHQDELDAIAGANA